jgi:hypothetical protein
MSNRMRKLEKLARERAEELEFLNAEPLETDEQEPLSMEELDKELYARYRQAILRNLASK